MRITYRTLAALCLQMDNNQLDSDVTLEVASENECYPVHLRICGSNHDSLDENHPVIYFDDLSENDDLQRLELIDAAEQIGLKITKTPVQFAKEIIRKALEGMPSSKRRELFEEIMEGYCEHCGREDNPCFCQLND